MERSYPNIWQKNKAQTASYIAVLDKLIVDAKGITNLATSSCTFCSFAANIVTGKVDIELEVAKAVNKALTAFAVNCLKFLVNNKINIACQKICKNNPNRKMIKNIN